jgi:hypothetical protein
MSIANVAREVIGDVRKSLILREPKGVSEALAGTQVPAFAGIRHTRSTPRRVRRLYRVCDGSSTLERTRYAAL